MSSLGLKSREVGFILDWLAGWLIGEGSSLPRRVNELLVFGGGLIEGSDDELRELCSAELFVYGMDYLVMGTF